MRLTAYSILLLVMIASCNENSGETKTQGDTVVKTSVVDTGKYLSQSRLEEYLQQTPATVVENIKAKPFDSIRFDKAIAYDYDGSDEGGPPVIDSVGKFLPVIKNQRALNASQVNSITSCLGSNESYGKGTASCFKPGMALVFFQQDRPVMTVEICLDCNFLQSSARIPAMYAKKTKIEGEEIELIGFSKEGRKCIIDLAKQLSFSYANEKVEY